MEHGHTIANTIGQSQKQIMELMRNRLSDGIQETKDMAQNGKPH